MLFPIRLLPPVFPAITHEVAGLTAALTPVTSSDLPHTHSNITPSFHDTESCSNNTLYVMVPHSPAQEGHRPAVVLSEPTGQTEPQALFTLVITITVLLAPKFTVNVFPHLNLLF